MTTKSQGRKDRDAQVIEMQSKPPESRMASFVLNSPTMPESLFSFIKQMVETGSVVTLFPMVRTYSPSLSPLEYGKAVQIASNPHGQILVRFVKNFDRKVEVEIEDNKTVLAQWSELNEVWEKAYNESWEPPSESG